MVWSRGPGKFCAPRTTDFKVLKMCSILEKVALALCFTCFLNFVHFDRPGAIQMNYKNIRLPWAEFLHVLHMVRRHLGCYWTAIMSLYRHRDFGFSGSWLTSTVRQSFGAGCVWSMRDSCAVRVRGLRSCHAPSLHASRAVTWLMVYRAPQVLVARHPSNQIFLCIQRFVWLRNSFSMAIWVLPCHRVKGSSWRFLCAEKHHTISLVETEIHLLSKSNTL